MRWTLLFLVLASICGVVQVFRGVVVGDGLSLLAFCFLLLALLAGWLTHAADKREMDRKYPR